MPNWVDDVRGQRKGALSEVERQKARVVIDRTERREQFKDQARLYIWWVTAAAGLAVTLAKLFLDHGAK